MVFKKSEYRKQYKDPVWDSHYPHYKEKVDYRIHRRQLEHHHHIFDWDWESENGNGNERDRPATAPNLNNSQARPEKGKTEVSDREVQTPEWSRMRGELSDEPCRKLRRDQDVECSPRPDGNGQLRDLASKPAALAHKHKGNNKHQVRDRRQARPSTSPVKRVDAKKERISQPPLVAFGWADQEMVTGCKKTHNIRASGNIYPSALRAMRRRQLDIQRKTEEDKQPNRKEQRMKAMFNVQPRDDSVWLTEYQRNFAGPATQR